MSRPGVPGLPRAVVLLTVLLVLMALPACAAGGNELAGTETAEAGFWLGLWHGLISPITFVVGLFREDVSIYEVRNSGNWYSFGFMIGVAIVFSGPPRARGGTRTSTRRAEQRRRET